MEKIIRVEDTREVAKVIQPFLNDGWKVKTLLQDNVYSYAPGPSVQEVFGMTIVLTDNPL
jgi:hypothetical protein